MKKSLVGGTLTAMIPISVMMAMPSVVIAEESPATDAEAIRLFNDTPSTELSQPSVYGPEPVDDKATVPPSEELDNEMVVQGVYGPEPVPEEPPIAEESPVAEESPIAEEPDDRSQTEEELTEGGSRVGEDALGVRLLVGGGAVAIAVLGAGGYYATKRRMGKSDTQKF